MAGGWRDQKGLGGAFPEQRNHAPMSLRARAAPGLLWLHRLSRITTSPFRSVGTSCVLTQRSNITPFIAPSMTHGASTRSWRKAPTKVWVRQCPKGA